MREIKFRAWDGQNYYDPINDSVRTFSAQLRDKSLIIEQYIGLKDKNGNEIYEGDIVSVRTDFYSVHNEEYDHDKTYTGEVKIIPSRGMCLKNPKWYCWISDTNGKDKNYKSFSAYKSEVIGNIHQNPELLG